MKHLRHFMTTFSAIALATALTYAQPAEAAEGTKFEQSKPLRIALVNFKTCVEKSKLGQKEQATFEALKKQMETVLAEKEKTLTEVAAKFNDIDYLDSLSPEAETELKRQYRTLTQEYTQQQNQFYQTLSQTNLSVIQKLNDMVTKATQEVAKKNQIDLVLNEESCFFFSPTIDISNMVIVIMDETFEKDSKETK